MMMVKKTREPRRRRFNADDPNLKIALKQLEEAQKQRDEYFNIETFLSMAAKLKARKIPVPRWTRTQDNLHVIVRNTGEISFHAIYTLPNGKRTSLLLGEHPDMTIKRAQPIVKTLQELANKGIDPQSGLHRRLIQEIETQGDKWRPH